jgi:hypothetical protein
MVAVGLKLITTSFVAVLTDKAQHWWAGCWARGSYAPQRAFQSCVRCLRAGKRA